MGNLKQINLGKGGPLVSSFGLGCMGMSDFYGNKDTRDDKESIATIHAALEAGISFFNTGDFYGMGHNELLLREAIKGKREKFFISVKFGALRSHNGQFLGYDVRPQAVKNFISYSLQRLGTDYIDLYQPSRPDPEVPVEDTVGAISELIQEGKVRYLGLSESGEEVIRRAHKVHPVSALEIEYSLATRVAEKKILPTTRELGISLVAYGALSRGLLSGTITGNLAAGDFRSFSPRFSNENLTKNNLLVEELKKIADGKGATPSQIALAWVANQGEDILTLIGTSKRTRLAENLKATEILLSDEEKFRLNEIFHENAVLGERYPSQGMAHVVS
ncbi:aldo/keto reductase [Leptospira ilyithenensis]|uniref:Aldo/keto reductase n=1 Tax=Leptospira ilyithenensis TaxID=2484901 RepID=A0A4V3JWY5_9LEPT|nr:aldo/keto reductase [Leptospira ilyithenensis]TGN09804.1 aldo/keto reductase [Leptospira ilyithenensis]